MDECAKFPGQLCDHICLNTPGSYRCACHDGFFLKSDERTCEQAVKGQHFSLKNKKNFSVLSVCGNNIALQYLVVDFATQIEDPHFSLKTFSSPFCVWVRGDVLFGCRFHNSKKFWKSAFLTNILFFLLWQC